MEQIRVVITGAGDKVAGAASGAGKKMTALGKDATQRLNELSGDQQASSSGDKKPKQKKDPKKKKTGGGVTEAARASASMESLSTTCPSLTKQQRLIGFGVCFCLGYLISFGSTFALMAGKDNGARFGTTYSLGNIIALCGSGFLVGPKQQVKLMFKPVRRVATVIYLTMIAAVLAVALAAPQLGLVVLLLVVVQLIAAVWYSASYIPYGRKILSNIAQKICGTAV